MCVKQILLPASPFILLPDLEENEQKNEDQVPVWFVNLSLTGLFLEQMRSQWYHVDNSMAHKLLLYACIWVMQRTGEVQ